MKQAKLQQATPLTAVSWPQADPGEHHGGVVGSAVNIQAKGQGIGYLVDLALVGLAPYCVAATLVLCTTQRRETLPGQAPTVAKMLRAGPGVFLLCALPAKAPKSSRFCSLATNLRAAICITHLQSRSLGWDASRVRLVILEHSSSLAALFANPQSRNWICTTRLFEMKGGGAGNWLPAFFYATTSLNLAQV